MSIHKSGCLLCGAPLVFTQQLETHRCALCGKEYESQASCRAGHFICDDCHADKAMLDVTAAALGTKSRDPVAISQAMMGSEHFHMHGPEHHYMVTAALLAAYKNAGGDIDLEAALKTARQRSGKLPGGICGMWGSCGAGISAGVFMSIVTGATPVSQREWSLANRTTSLCLADIADNGGPRCCKRNTRLAITRAARFAGEQLGVQMELGDYPACAYSGQNDECRRENCLYFSPPL